MIGRIKEINILENKYNSTTSDFVAVFGRRRVGKTYLIRNVFKNTFAFQLTGLSNASLQVQLHNFNTSLKEYYPKYAENSTNWMDAFYNLRKCLEKSKLKKKVIFLDELPWLDTPNSNFLQALEHFWNSWASGRNDILLIVCGSAASWMINKLINNKGGLHNRVTQKLKIEPFTLKECELLLKSKKITLDKYQILQIYMALGGIPFYWENIEKGKSATQNINSICFETNGLLRTEFTNIFKSLFNKAENHEAIVYALAKKSKGLTREEIIAESKLSNGGSFTRMLEELEYSGFIRKYVPFGKKNRNSLYQLVDFYSLFYLKFIKNHPLTDANYWLKILDSPKYRAWSGYAFEQVCLSHLEQIKKGLGISGIEATASSWRSKNTENGVQIDLVIDRRDQVINLCEMKFSIQKFEITKKYKAELLQKIAVFREETATEKALFLSVISTYGVKKNTHFDVLQNDINMSILYI